jgi:hypothetical protein
MHVITVTSLCALFVLVGCVQVSDLDLTIYEPTCARQCTMAYSSCVAGGSPAVGAPTGVAYECKEGLKLCAQTCPRR